MDTKDFAKKTIQIYARVRPTRANSSVSDGRYWVSNPVLADDENDFPKIGFHIPKDQNAGMVNNQKENFDFKFDKVFDVNTQQEEVFDVVAKPVVNSVLQGYNGTIFAYEIGQTGSGKTFTITGGAERYMDRGIIPRSIQHIFKEKERSKDRNYEICISYLEIYNEMGYDLLDSSRDAKGLEDLPKVTLQEDADEIIHLRNLKSIPVSNEEDALNLLFVGDTNRMIAETPSNPSSSRSHCIFIITVSSRQEGGDIIRRSKLHLVDLAGSERVARTGIGGNLLKEAKYINLSLHYLEQVIIALQEKSTSKRSHIPYRNSMMTSVLRDSLGGNCMTTMIATCAVEDSHVDESISTCRFAQRVALISNNAILNEETDPYLTIARLKREIARLKAELALSRGELAVDEDLPDYERERVKQAVQDFLSDPSADASLNFCDFRKIHYAFCLFKQRIQNPSNLQNSCQRHNEQPTLQVADIQELIKIKSLVEHRDNEIKILVSMIKNLQMQIKDKDPISRSASNVEMSISEIEQSNLKPFPFLKDSSKDSSRDSLKDSSISKLQKSIPRLTTEKAKAFDIFKSGYPSGPWIDGQKSLLKTKYTLAKTLGESAQQIRNEIKVLKSDLSLPDLSDVEKQDIKDRISTNISNYKDAYQQLKELKLEIEHLQHLLEHARIRLTRDFEHWYVNVYLETSQEETDRFIQKEKEFTYPNAGAEAAKKVLQETKSHDSVENDIKAFYKSRELLLKSGRNTPVGLSSSFCK